MRTLAGRSERTVADISDYLAPGPARRTQVDEVEAYRTLRRVASRRAASSRNGETDSVTSRQSPFRTVFPTSLHRLRIERRTAATFACWPDVACTRRGTARAHRWRLSACAEFLAMWANRPMLAMQCSPRSRRWSTAGYDSWGMAIAVDGQLAVTKTPGKISVASVDFPEAEIGFGHTRWATHGGVTQANAHPHLDCTGSIAVIHNGIIENFRELAAGSRESRAICSAQKRTAK